MDIVSLDGIPKVYFITTRCMLLVNNELDPVQMLIATLIVYYIALPGQNQSRQYGNSSKQSFTLVHTFKALLASPMFKKLC